VKNPRIIHRRKIWANWEENAGIIKIEALRRTYAGLKFWGEMKEYKPKYADAKFRSIYGYWPPDEILEVPSYSPTTHLRWWIAKSNEAWKKARRLEELHRAASPVPGDGNPRRAVRTGPLIFLPPLEDAPSLMTADDWSVEL
jgi:hypothetical protein